MISTWVYSPFIMPENSRSHLKQGYEKAYVIYLNTNLNSNLEG